MSSFSQTFTTPGDTTHTVDSNVSGEVTIEAWGPGAGGYYSLAYGGGGGGEYRKGRFTISGGAVLNLHIPAGGAPGNGSDAATVVDNATSGTDVDVQAAPGGPPPSGGIGGTGGHATGSLLVGGSAVNHDGGDGFAGDGSSAAGGGSSGCAAADGVDATTGTGAASAGTDSGAGGNGSLAGTGSNGSAPGGGGGNGAVDGGSGARGQVRISYEIADVAGSFSATLINPGSQTLTIDSDVSGNVTIECWGGGGGGYNGLDYGGGGGGAFVKGVYTISGSAVLDLTVGAGGVSDDGTASTVVDHATSGTNVSLISLGGRAGNISNGYGGYNLNCTVDGALMVAASDVKISGGNGGGANGAVGSGGGSSACPTAPGNNATGITGGTSAGTDSGAGGNGSLAGSGSAGVAPGGGGGNGLLGGGAGAAGQVRISYEIAEAGTPPTFTSNGGGSTANISIAENTTAVTTVTATGDATIVFSKTGGADTSKFTLTGSVLTFTAAPDYETPTDANTDNVYVVEITATNDAGTDVQTISVTVTNVVTPANTVVPAVTGQADGDGTIALIGHTLSCTTGTWSNTPTSYTYQWRSASSLGGSYSDIGGQTSATYTATAGFRRCRVTATNSEGSATADSNETHVLAAGTVPAATEIAPARDLTTFYGRFPITYESLSDVSAETMPDPVVWSAASPEASADWGCIATAKTMSGSRMSSSGAVLISPSWCVSANHHHPESGSIEFTKRDGTLVSRTAAVGSTNSFNPGGDLFLFKLTAPVTDISPAYILADSTELAGEDVLALELNWHLSRQTMAAGLDNTDASAVFSSPTADIIETGDSGHPLLAISDSAIVLVGVFYEATTVPNLSHYLDDIAAIVAQSGEQIRTCTILPVLITSNGGGATAAVEVAEEGTTPVTTVVATADDTVVYSIDGDDAALFEIDADTGVLAFQDAQLATVFNDDDANGVYLVTVIATTEAGSDSQDLSVTVVSGTMVGGGRLFAVMQAMRRRR